MTGEFSRDWAGGLGGGSTERGELGERKGVSVSGSECEASVSGPSFKIEKHMSQSKGRAVKVSQSCSDICKPSADCLDG